MEINYLITMCDDTYGNIKKSNTTYIGDGNLNIQNALIGIEIFELLIMYLQ